MEEKVCGVFATVGEGGIVRDEPRTKRGIFHVDAVVRADIVSTI